MKKLGFVLGILVLLACTHLLAARVRVIRPGNVWLDSSGQQIQAHGGGVIRWHGRYYWFGEDRTSTNDPEKRYVSCYSSKDLARWTSCGQVLALSDPEHLGKNWVLERPKVFPNRRTGKFVLYFHLDDAKYQFARVGVAVSNRIDGPYTYVHSFRPLGQESRDIGQFIDDDGSAYLIFEARPTRGFFIGRLSDDYLEVSEKMSFIHAPLEGGALVHDKGIYYVVGSHMTGWAPNSNVYATSNTLIGPWTEFKDMAPPEAKTYGAQSTMLLKVEGTKQTTVIFMADIWKPKTLWDSRYLWMPVEIEDGKLHLPAPQPWSINVKTGVTQLK